MQNGNGTTAVKAPPPSGSRLGAVKKRRLPAPLRFIFYGTEGVGKTTLAANAPDPIWFDVEDGSGKVTVARYMFRPDDEAAGHVPASYADIGAGIEDLTRNPHDFKTLVIDTADRLESLIWRHMIARDKGRVKAELETIEDYGFGKGYNIAIDEWRSLCARLDALRQSRGMSIILLAHSHVKLFKSPDSDDYERHNLQINEKAGGFLKGWADVVGFCRFEEGAGKSPGSSRVKGWSTGRRLVNFVRTAAYDAKGRGGMPAELELDPINPWGPIARAIADADGLSADDLKKLIDAETARIGSADLTAKVNAAVAEAIKTSNTETLNRYLQDLKRREPVSAAA